MINKIHGYDKPNPQVPTSRSWPSQMHLFQALNAHRTVCGRGLQRELQSSATSRARMLNHLMIMLYRPVVLSDAWRNSISSSMAQRSDRDQILEGTIKLWFLLSVQYGFPHN